MSFFRFQMMSIVAFVILWKPNVCQKADSQVVSDDGPGQSNCKTFELSKTFQKIFQKLLEV